MKYDVQFTTQFKKDLKLAKKQSKNLDKLFEVIDTLANGGTLDAKNRYPAASACLIAASRSSPVNSTSFPSLICLTLLTLRS